MEIKWYGQSCFALQTKKVKIIIDPYSDSIGLKLPLQLTANIVLVTHNHQDHNNVEAISGNNGEKPFRITGPGEYEVSGIYFHGIGSFHDKLEGKERGLNTIYTIDDGNIRLCHLGDLGTGLSDEQLEQIGEVDILFVPVGGTYTIDVAKAVLGKAPLLDKIVRGPDKGLNLRMFFDLF